MGKTTLDEELILRGLSRTELCSHMVDEVHSYVSGFKEDGMYDTCTIASWPDKNWYWFVRENGTFLWDRDDEHTGATLRHATEIFSKRRIYCIERTDEGYTIELIANTYEKEPDAACAISNRIIADLDLD